MSITELRDYLDNLTSHILFTYDRHDCGIDPLSLNSFDMWCDDNEINAKSVDDVLSLTEIWNNVNDIEY